MLGLVKGLVLVLSHDNDDRRPHNSPLNSVGNHLINAEGMLAWLCSTKVSTVQIQFHFIYSSPRDIPDNVEPEVFSFSFSFYIILS